MLTLIIDNYDSYTFNLYQMIAEANGKLPLVIRNNEINWDELKNIPFDNIVISPGPGSPERSADFGICSQIIENVDVPLLGVCLGHQGLGYIYGGKVIHAPEVRHGRISKIYHNGSELFQSIPSPFSAVRYHSLLVADELPECLEKIAWTEEGLVMGLRHRYLPFWGVQFHPESICTESGQILLNNFRDITRKFINKYPISPENKYGTVSQSICDSVDDIYQEEEKFEGPSRFGRNAGCILAPPFDKGGWGLKTLLRNEYLCQSGMLPSLNSIHESWIFVPIQNRYLSIYFRKHRIAFG